MKIKFKKSFIYTSEEVECTAQRNVSPASYQHTVLLPPALLPRASGYHLGCIYVTETVLSTLGEIKSSEMQAQFSGGGSSVGEHNYPGDRSYYVQRTERSEILGPVQTIEGFISRTFEVSTRTGRSLTAEGRGAGRVGKSKGVTGTS